MQPRIDCSYRELVPITSLIPYRKNRNKHGSDQIARLAKLIEHHGMRSPIVVSNLSGEVVAGNGRLAALKLLGAESAPVDYQDFESEDAEYAYSVSDNAIAEWAELDLKGINSDLPDLFLSDIDLLGLKSFEIDPGEEKPKDSDPKKREVVCQACGEINVI